MLLRKEPDVFYVLLCSASHEDAAAFVVVPSPRTVFMVVVFLSLLLLWCVSLLLCMLSNVTLAG